jgi:anti-sigma regulatory factor (Ser/Thr protein kinase)
MSLGEHGDSMPSDLDTAALDAGMEERSTFDPYPQSVPQARAFVLSIEWIPDNEETRARLATLTSEIVTNAVLHARTSFVVSVTKSPSRIRLAVVDRNVQPVLRKTYSQTSPTGRGLHIVEALADRWGVDKTADGKTVWFEIDLETQQE